MNILVVDRDNSWHVNDLRRAAGAVHEVSTATYLELSAFIGADLPLTSFNAGQKHITDFDVIFVRAMPASTLEQIVFRMDVLQQIEFQLKIPVINPAKTIEYCIDKYLSLEKLRSWEIPVPQTGISQKADTALQQFQELGSDCIVKPIFGSRGRGVVRIRDDEEAIKHFRQIENDGCVIYQQQIVRHDHSDVRLLVVGDEVFAMQRKRPGNWVTNASQGAECLPYIPKSEECDLAFRAAQSLDALVAGVDVVYEGDQPYVVEVNACPAWPRISSVNEGDVARAIVDLLARMNGD